MVVNRKEAKTTPFRGLKRTKRWHAISFQIFTRAAGPLWKHHRKPKRLPTVLLTNPHECGLYFICCRRTRTHCGRTNDGGHKDDLGFPQHGPRHVTDPSQGQSINSSSRRSSHVVPNAKNSNGTQMSRCASDIRYFDGYIRLRTFNRTHSAVDRKMRSFRADPKFDSEMAFKAHEAPQSWRGIIVVGQAVHKC